MQLICYIISVMDSIVERVRSWQDYFTQCNEMKWFQDYVVVYFHSDTTSDNRPELALLRDFYDIIDNRLVQALMNM